MDNYGTHKVTNVRTWLAPIPAITCISPQPVAVRLLEKAMLDYLDQRNKDPKPFLWTADADLSLGKVARLSKRISNS